MNLSLKAILLLAVVSTYCLSVNAQNNSNDLIAASQSGSSPLFFKPTEADISSIKLVDLSSEIETNVRRGIPNFFEKSRTKKELTVAYIGGSITAVSQLGYFCIPIKNYICRKNEDGALTVHR